jgi:hypothetical protein
MTKQQVLRLYGDVRLIFRCYKDYVFEYSGTTSEGYNLTVHYSNYRLGDRNKTFYPYMRLRDNGNYCYLKLNDCREVLFEEEIGVQI